MSKHFVSLTAPFALPTLFTLLALVTLSAPASAQKFDNLAKTPPMGWNSWNTFASNISEQLVHEIADTMVANGMQAAGYQYIVLDDCWSAMKRDKDGNLVAHPEKFPSGMKALGDYLHEKGFKFGIYNCAGTETCAGYPGGHEHEEQDAKMYASWGVDYLKYDWCNTSGADPKVRYAKMRDALHAAGRPIVFSMCEWGQSKPWEWAKDTAHLWRTTGDITDCWDCELRWSHGVKRILDMQKGLEDAAGPGHWNDPDMLEVGNDGLTFAESRAHFSLWCMLAAPLMAGNDIRKMTPEILAVMTNREAIAIDQDPLGKQGYRVFADKHYEAWVKPLAGDEWAVCLLNVGDAPAEIKLDLRRLQSLPGARMMIRDIWRGTGAGGIDVGGTDKEFSAQLEPHDVALLRLTPVKPGE